MNLEIIEIPYSPISLFLYNGEDGLKDFKQRMCILYPGREMPEGYQDNDGMCVKNTLWVEDKKDIENIFHELQHFFDYLFEYIGIIEEGEFKACIVGHVANEVIKWVAQEVEE